MNKTKKTVTTKKTLRPWLVDVAIEHLREAADVFATRAHVLVPVDHRRNGENSRRRSG